MGSGGSKKLKEEETKANKDLKFKRKNEVKIEGSQIRSIDSCLFEVCPSICKIVYPTEKGINKGTGFLIKLYKGDESLFCLMTNEHVITKGLIEKKIEIEVFYYNTKKRIKIILDENERFIQNYKDINIDCTIIEILGKDNVSEDYFLNANVDYNAKNYSDLKNKKIYVVQFPEGKNLSHSEGEIVKIGGNLDIDKGLDKYEFSHKASTELGSSGSPIFLENTTQVIGIHKQSDNFKQINYGYLIFPIVDKLKKANNNNKKYLNKILDNENQSKNKNDNMKKEVNLFNNKNDSEYQLNNLPYLC